LCPDIYVSGLGTQRSAQPPPMEEWETEE